MKPPRPRNPVIPGNPKERTGTAGILRRAVADIRRRFAGLEREVAAMVDALPRLGVNDGAEEVDIYMLTPSQLEALSVELRAAVDRWLAGARDLENIFWWDGYVAEAAQLGAAQSVANLSGLSTTYAAATSLQSVIYSEPYRNRLAMAQFKSYEHWTGLADAQKSELAQIIGRGVMDGKNPRSVKKEIAERMGVSKARAAQYAQTDITDTLRRTRWAEKERAEQTLGLKLGLLWTSALLPTTRPWHASRNGRVYTTEDVKTFYNQAGNRYRCHCAQTECLLDAEGKPILTKYLQSAMANERKKWQSENLKTSES